MRVGYMEPNDVWLSYWIEGKDDDEDIHYLKNKTLKRDHSLKVYASWLLKQTTHLGIAPFHVTQRHLGVNWVTAGHTEDLQISVVIALVDLQGKEKRCSGHCNVFAVFTVVQMSYWNYGYDDLSPLHRTVRPAVWP